MTDEIKPRSAGSYAGEIHVLKLRIDELEEELKRKEFYYNLLSEKFDELAKLAKEIANGDARL